MMLIRYALIGFVLGVIGFIVLGPARDFLPGLLRRVPALVQNIAHKGSNATNPVLSEQVQPPDLSGVFKRTVEEQKSVSLPIVSDIFQPVVTTVTSIQQTVEQIQSLPQDQLDAIKSQICGPQ